MTEISINAAKIALGLVDGAAFEEFSKAAIASIVGPTFRPLGGHKDGGADGLIEAGVLEAEKRPSIFFQASIEEDVEKKIRRTVQRLKEFGRDPRTLFYASSQVVRYIDKLEYKLEEELGVVVKIYDREYFAANINYSASVQSAYRSYVDKFLDPLRQEINPSYPVRTPIKNARAVSAFLGQEIERRIGTATTLVLLTDALILWALEGTDPERDIYLTEDEIVGKIEDVIPTAKAFIRGQAKVRLSELSKKTAQARSVNYHKNKGYCLPFETRKTLSDATVEDEDLKSRVSDSIRERIAAVEGSNLSEKAVEKLVDAVHTSLETVFERQGYEATQHFLDEASEDAIDSRALIDIVSSVLSGIQLQGYNKEEMLHVAKSVLRGVFYSSEECEREYCSRLARTYVLLFMLKNTPEVIEFFNGMSKNLKLYVGTDVLVRAISEYYLPEVDQMTVNALRIIQEAGSRLILTEMTLEEVHSHINASHREFVNTYAEIENYIDASLASQCDRILIRAYFYSRNSKDPRRAKSWGAYLGNFLTVSKLFNATSPDSMESLRATLCQRFNLEYEPLETMEAGVDPDERHQLAEKIAEIRQIDARDERAINDARHILAVYRHRQTEKMGLASPFGGQTWWLTQELKSSRAAAQVFPKRNTVRYVMKMEFLLNYIALNPATPIVRESLRRIFPSVMGVRLGSRLQDHALKSILGQIKSASLIDEARANSIVAEHSNALKGGHMREFLIKYDEKNSLTDRTAL